MTSDDNDVNPDAHFRLPFNQRLGLASLLIIAAFCCTLASNHVCDYVLLAGVSKSGGTTATFGRGLWRGDVDGSIVTGICRSYSFQYKDSQFITARIFSVISDILAIVSFLTAPCLPYAPLLKQQLRGIGWKQLYMCLFQGMTMLLWPSNACRGAVQNILSYRDVTCGMGRGMKLAIASCVMWFLSGVIIMGTPSTVPLELLEAAADAAARRAAQTPETEPLVTEEP